MAQQPPRLAPYILRHPRALAGSLLVILATVVVHMAIPLIPEAIIDRLTEGRLELKEMGIWCGMLLAAASLGAWLSMWMRRFPLGLGNTVQYEIRRDIFNHLTRLDDAYFRGERTGDIMTRMTSDLLAVREMVGQCLLQVTRTLLAIVIAFSVMFFKSPKLTLVMLVLLPLISIAGFYIIRVLRRRYERSQEHFSEMSNFFQESFAGIRLIKGLGVEARQEARFDGMNEEYVKRNLAMARLESPLWPMMGMAFTLGVMLILWIGGREVIDGRMTLGELILFQQYLLYLQWPMLALGWTMNLVQRGTASWRRICRILESESAVHDGDLTRPELREIRGDLEFRHVSLELGGQPILTDINLSIPEGMTVGITGPTGCGKTLLAALLVRRMDPSSGQVFCGVNDLREYPLEVLRGQIRVAPQEPFLFSDTLGRNILYGTHDPEPQSMLWAAEVAQLRDEAEDFDEGFSTPLGERGVTLSGGQRQRASIARAIVSNPQVLILDDTLSAVDTQTEAGILNGLKPIMRERTSILISHRVSTLREADFIVVMDHGTVVQLGSHRELIEQEGYYRELDITQRLEAELEAME